MKNPFQYRLTWFWVLSIVGLAAPWIISVIRHYEPESYQCRVASVSDGDTLRVTCGGEKKKIRLYCIDAPEMKQRPWGRESRDHLRSLARRGSSVTIIKHTTDRYGRIVGEVISADGSNLNQAQVRGGQAAIYRKYCATHSNPDYFGDERLAKAEYLGIWSKQGLQQKPWEFRHR